MWAGHCDSLSTGGARWTWLTSLPCRSPRQVAPPHAPWEPSLGTGQHCVMKAASIPLGGPCARCGGHGRCHWGRPAFIWPPESSPADSETHTEIYLRVCVCIHMHTHTYIHTYIHMYIYAYIHKHTHTHMFACTYTMKGNGSHGYRGWEAPPHAVCKLRPEDGAGQFGLKAWEPAERKV